MLCLAILIAMSSLQPLHQTLSTKNTRLHQLYTNIAMMDSIFIEHGQLSEQQEAKVADWKNDLKSLDTEIKELTQKITELSLTQEITELSLTQEKTKQEGEKTKQVEAEEKTKQEGEKTKQTEIAERERTAREAKEQEEITRRTEAELAHRSRTAEPSAMSTTEMWNAVSTEVEALILPALPTLPAEPAALPSYWSDVQKAASDEVAGQRLLHEKMSEPNGQLVPKRIFINGNDNKMLGKSIIPDELVFEEGYTGSLTNVLLLVEWKSTKVALANEEKGQAINEGQYYLKKTGRPFIHVVLSNFVEFRFFKVASGPSNFKYYQSDPYNTADGFAHLHNLLSQDPASYLGTNFMPAIPNIKIIRMVGKGATSFVYEGKNNSGTPVAVKFLHEKHKELATEETKVLKVLGSKANGIPELTFADHKLPDRIVVMSPFLSQLVRLFWSDVESLFNTLRYIHREGYLHRDIRPDNVMTTGKKAYIVDFGFALPKDHPPLEYKGTMSTASDRILTCLIDDDNTGRTFDYQEEDDVQSLVKTVYLLKNPEEKLPKNRQPSDLLDFWQRPPEAWTAALKAKTLDTALNALQPLFRT